MYGAYNLKAAIEQLENKYMFELNETPGDMILPVALGQEVEFPSPSCSDPRLKSKTKSHIIIQKNLFIYLNTVTTCVPSRVPGPDLKIIVK